MPFNIAEWIIRIPVLLFAITIHEYAHGRLALSLGDPTAKNAGRLTFNPIRATLRLKTQEDLRSTPSAILTPLGRSAFSCSISVGPNPSLWTSDFSKISGGTQ
jgi:Zn-dependent protease